MDCLILQLIADYDITLLMEVMDANGDVVPGLQEQINRYIVCAVSFSAVSYAELFHGDCY